MLLDIQTFICNPEVSIVACRCDSLLIKKHRAKCRVGGPRCQSSS